MRSIARFATALRAPCIAVLLAAPLPAAATAELVMFEEAGCVYCARWNAEIAPAYPNTAEGQRLPLRRVNIRDQHEVPALTMRVTYTPTFVMIDAGQELGRIEGYPGEDFFWALLEQMIGTLPQNEGETRP